MKNKINIFIVLLLIFGGISVVSYLSINYFSGKEDVKKEIGNQLKLGSNLKTDEWCQIKMANSLDGFYEIDTKGIEFKTAIDTRTSYKLHEKPSINSSQIKDILKKKSNKQNKFELQIFMSSETVDKYTELTEKNYWKTTLFCG